MAEKKKHPGFKKAQAEIAKKANPNLKKVKGK